MRPLLPSRCKSPPAWRSGRPRALERASQYDLRLEIKAEARGHVRGIGCRPRF